MSDNDGTTRGNSQELLDRAATMPYGRGRSLLLESALAEVEAAGDVASALVVRLELVKAYRYGGEPERVFRTYDEAIAGFEADPGAYAEIEDWVEQQLRWYDKWIASLVEYYPDVTLDQTREVLASMERRYQAAGQSLRAVYQRRTFVARLLGDLASADTWYARWIEAERDSNADCAACELASRIEYLASRDRDEDAVALAGPLLDALARQPKKPGDERIEGVEPRGEDPASVAAEAYVPPTLATIERVVEDTVGSEAATCPDQPQGVLTELVLPLLRIGRYDQAVLAHRLAYRRLRRDPSGVGELAAHLRFCAATGNEERALALVEAHLSWLAAAASPGDEMRFTAAAALVLRRLVETGRGELTLVRPRRPGAADAAESTAADTDSAGTPEPSGRVGQPSGVAGSSGADEPGESGEAVTVAALADELRGRALELAAIFDQRNGSDVETVRTLEVLDTRPVVEHLALAPHDRVELRPARAYARDNHASDVDPRLDAELDALEPAELLDRAEELWRRRRVEDAAPHLNRYDQRAAVQRQPPALEARREDLRGAELVTAHDVVGGAALWERAARLYAETGDEERRQQALGRLGTLRCQRGAVEQGLALVEESTEALLDSGTPAVRAAAAIRLARTYLVAGRFTEATDVVARAVELADESGYDIDVADAAFFEAQLAALDSERGEEACKRAEQARIAYRGLDPEGLVWACMLHGELLSRTGASAEAIEGAWTEAISAAGEDPEGRGHALGARGRWLLDSAGGPLHGVQPEAQASGETASGTATQTETANGTANGTEPSGGGDGTVLARVRQARADLLEAYARFVALGFGDLAATTGVELARAYLANGQALEAAELAERCLPVIEALGDGAGAVLGGCRFVLAHAMAELGEAEEAAEQFGRLALLHAANDDHAGAGTWYESAGGLLDVADLDEDAAGAFDAAARAYASAGDLLGEVRALRRCGLAVGWTGELEAALGVLEGAGACLDTAPDQTDPSIRWERGWLQYATARMCAADERFADGLEEAGRAVETFGELAELELPGTAEALDEAEALREAIRETEAQERRRAEFDREPDTDPE